MELAADAFLAVGSTRADRLQLDGLADRLLPECAARGNGGHQKRRHCVQGAVLIAAGVVCVSDYPYVSIIARSGLQVVATPICLMDSPDLSDVRIPRSCYQPLCA